MLLKGSNLMTQDEFDKALVMLRSRDFETFEDGFGNLGILTEDDRYFVRQLVDLMKVEPDIWMRSALIELIGDVDSLEFVPDLVEELSYEDREARAWAYSKLSVSNHELARDHAERYRLAHPDEDFY
jgi:hypothetical protein